MPSNFLISTTMMDTASIYNNQTSENEYDRAPSPSTSLSPTLVNEPPHHNPERRPSLRLVFPSGASNILNSAVINAAGQSIYSISSTSKRTTMISCRDNVEVANVLWDRHSPQMVLDRKKVKCKEWLKLAEADNDSRLLTLGNAQFTWRHMHGQSFASGQLIPTNRPGMAIARWHTKSSGDELFLEVFQETPVESGLLDSIILSIVLIRSGQSLGDSHGLFSSNPLFSPILVNSIGRRR